MTRILDLLADGARPGAALEMWPDDGAATSLADLWERSELAARGVGERVAPGEAIGFVLESSTACLAAVLGAWRAGATVVSLPLRAPGQSAPEYAEALHTMLRGVGAEHLLAPPAMGDRLVPTLGSGPDPVHFAGFDQVRGGSGRRREENGAFVQFSSGTTGRPKGILLSPEALAANARAIVDRYDDGTTMTSASWLPLSHDMGLVGLFLAPWAYCGLDGGRDGRIVLTRPEVFLRAPRAWMQMCSDVSATVTGGPTFALEAAARAHRGDDIDLSSIRVVCVGAETVWPDSLRRFEATFADRGLGPGALSPAYGMAEAALGVTAAGPGERWVERDVPHRDGTTIRAVSTGGPLAGVEVRTAPDGEIEVRSPSLLTTYVVGPPPPMTADGWYRSGDDGVVVDGALHVIGRRDDLLTVAGRNVRATDVERRLETDDALGLSTCAVIADGTRCAVIAARRIPRTAASDDEVARAVKGRATLALGLAPVRVLLVSRRALPRTGTGKLKRAELIRAYTSGQLEVLSEVT